MCLCVGMWMCESSYPPSQKGALDTLELEFQQLVVKLPSGCRDLNWVLCKSSCTLSHRVIFQLQFYIKKILNVNTFYIAVLMTTVLFTMGVYSLSSLTLQHISTSPQVPPLHPEMWCRYDLSVFSSAEEIEWLIQRINDEKAFYRNCQIASSMHGLKSFQLGRVSLSFLMCHGFDNHFLPNPSGSPGLCDSPKLGALYHHLWKGRNLFSFSKIVGSVPITSLFFLSRFSTQFMLSKHEVTMNSASRSTRESIYWGFVI